MYTLEQTKRGLCPYDDKRYLLADLPDGTPNPQTHAYGHKDLLVEEVQHADDMPDDPNAELIVQPYMPLTKEQIEEQATRREARIKLNHDRVLRTVARIGDRDSDGEELPAEGFDALPDGNADGDLDDAEYVRAQHAASARPGARGRVDQVIEQLCAVGRL